MRIVDRDHVEFSVGRDIDANPDHAFREQHGVRRPAIAADIVPAFAIRSVVGREDRIGALGLVEPCLHMRGRNRPRVAGLMTGDTPASVGAEILKEGIGQIEVAVDVDRFQHAIGVRGGDHSGIRIGCQRERDRRDHQNDRR
jgi:hypothetical protein